MLLKKTKNNSHFFSNVSRIYFKELKYSGILRLALKTFNLNSFKYNWKFGFIFWAKKKKKIKH